MDNLKTWLTTPNSKPLWKSKNGKWQVEKLDNEELAITDGWAVCYAWLNKNEDGLVVDKAIYPEYVEDKAIKLAKQHIESIYK